MSPKPPGPTCSTQVGLDWIDEGTPPRRAIGNLRQRGVSVRETWNTSKSAHGPWRLSKTPALTIALPLHYFQALGVPSLAGR